MRHQEPTSPSTRRELHTGDQASNVTSIDVSTALGRFQQAEKKIFDNYRSKIGEEKSKRQTVLDDIQQLKSKNRNEKKSSDSSPWIEVAIEKLQDDLTQIDARIAELSREQDAELKKNRSVFRSEVGVSQIKNDKADEPYVSLVIERGSDNRAQDVGDQYYESISVENNAVSQTEPVVSVNQGGQEIGKALDTIKATAPTYDELLANQKIRDVAKMERMAAEKAKQDKEINKKTAETDLKDSLSLRKPAQENKPYLPSAQNKDLFDNMSRDATTDNEAYESISVTPAQDTGDEKTEIRRVETAPLNYQTRFPGTEIFYRSGEYIRLPAQNGKNEAVQLTKVPEIVLDAASGENGVKFTYAKIDGTTETKTYYQPLEKVTGSEIQQNYKAGDMVRVPRGTDFEVVKITDKPGWNHDQGNDEIGYTFTYEKKDGSLETKTFYEPLQHVKENVKEADLALYSVQDRVEFTVDNKKIEAKLAGKPQIFYDKKGEQKVLFSYILDNGTEGAIYLDSLPRIIQASAEKNEVSEESKTLQENENQPDVIPELNKKEKEYEPYASFEMGGESFDYTFGEYVFYQAGGRWNIGSIQAEPKFVENGTKIEFHVMNERTGVLEKISVDKPLKKFKPLENKTLRVGRINYKIEAGRIGEDGEVEYQLVSQRDEVVPDVNIEIIRNLQEADKVARETKDKIKAIELRIGDLATNKVRDIMGPLNELQLRLHALGADFSNPNSWKTQEKGQVQDLARSIRKFKHEATRALNSLDESVREQEMIWGEYQAANFRKVAREDVKKDMDALGITEKLKKDNPKEYYRLLDTVYEDLAKEPGNVLYKELHERLSQEIESADGTKLIDANRYLVILEDILKDWRDEKVEAPHLDFKKQYELDLLPQFKELEARVSKIEGENKEKYDKVSELLFAAQNALDQVKQNDPRLPLTLLKTWQAVGKLRIGLDNLDRADRKKEREKAAKPAEVETAPAQPKNTVDASVAEKKEMPKVSRFELTTKALNELLSTRSGDVKKIVEQLYTTSYEVQGAMTDKLNDLVFKIKDVSAVADSLKKLFASDTAPTPAIMDVLRTSGVHDWKTFKSIWNEKYATKVATSLVETAVATIKQRARETRNQQFVVKDETLLGKVFGKPNRFPDETDPEKVKRVADKIVSEHVDRQHVGATPEAISAFAAELAIAVRKSNLEGDLDLMAKELNELYSDGFDSERRRRALANIIGVSVENLDESLEIRFVGSEQKHRLKKSLNRVIEDQINALEQQLNARQKTTAPQGEAAPAAKIEAPVQPATTVENNLDEEFIGEKRKELKRMVEVIGDRVQDIRNLQSDPKTKATWMDLADVRDSVDQAYEDAEKLRKMLNNSSADTTMNQLVHLPILRPEVLEAVAEGLSLREELLRARESKGALVRLQVIEGGLKNIEKAGGTQTATSKEHRQVIGGLRSTYARNKKVMNVALAGMFALGSGGLINRYSEKAIAAASASENEPVPQESLRVERGVPAKAVDLVTDQVLRDAKINPSNRPYVVEAMQKAFDKAPEKGRIFAAAVRAAKRSGNQDLMDEALNHLFKNNSLNSDALAEWLTSRKP